MGLRRMHIDRRVLIALLMAFASIVIGFAVSAMTATPAHADSSTIAGNGAGGGGAYTVRYREIHGDPKGGGNTPENQVIAKLVQQHGGNFECMYGTAWAAYAVQENRYLALRANGNAVANMNLAGNWDGGAVGGGDPLWWTYVNDPQTPRAVLNSGWIAGCVLTPSNHWGQYSYDVQMYDLASKTSVNNAPLNTCVAMYDNYAIGTDGYPIGDSYTKENKPSNGELSADGNSVITPYGQLYNTILQGAYSQKSNSSAESNALRDKLVAAVNSACDSTAKTQTGMTIPTDSAISTNLAKGGIAEVVKQDKRQTIEYPITGGEWYYKPVTKTIHVVHNCGTATSWNDDHGNHPCNIVGQVNNSTSTSWNASSPWIRDDGSKDATNNFRGRQFTGTYYCQSNNGQTSRAEYLNGCWDNVKNQVTVSYTQNSWQHVLHYDVLNLLCDKQDFETYKQLMGNAGFSGVTDNSVTPNGGKFQGSLLSAVSTDENSGSFTRMAQRLAQAGKLPGWTTAKVQNLYASYSPKSDPVYTKECPFDCTASKDGDTAKSNGASSNVNTNGATNGSRSGIASNPSNGDGSQSNRIANGADTTFFRNNAWNELTPDIWYPQSGNGVVYDGSKAKSTIIRRASDGTPWNDKGSGATIQYQNGGQWITLFTGASNGDLGSQTSPDTAATGLYTNDLTQVLSGQQNKLRIKAPWASDAGHPLKFNVKWEYNVKNKATVINGISGTGDSGTATTTTEDAVSDGKCDGTYSNVYKDTTTTTYNNSGAGSTDETDRTFDSTDALARAFTVTFVRVTSD